MGRELIKTYAVFEESLHSAQAHFTSLGSQWDVIGESSVSLILCTADSETEALSRSANTSLVKSAALGQPLCTAIQIALVHLLQSWGIEPVAVTGHSSGEIAAAYACGAISFEDALTVAYYRGLHASSIPVIAPEKKGVMMAVGLSESEAAIQLNQVSSSFGTMVIACVNSESSVTISGDATAIEELQHLLESNKIFNSRLHVDTAYHSHHMEVIAEAYRLSISNICPKVCKNGITFWSSVVGTQLPGTSLGSEYVSQVFCFLVKPAPPLATNCPRTFHRIPFTNTSR